MIEWLILLVLGICLAAISVAVLVVAGRQDDARERYREHIPIEDDPLALDPRW